jgi:predicted dehydrogenase
VDRVIDGAKTVALVGLGGYGLVYLKALLDRKTEGKIKFVAGVDPAPEACERLPEIQERGIPVFQSLEEFSRAGGADLVILSTPLQLHCEQACVALGAGAHVLCEKPLGAHPEQVRLMIEARDRNRRQLAIGYQWSFSPAIQQLKRDIASGRFGQPKRLRTRVYWPRDEKYYSRSHWAGRQRDTDGRLVLDSPANNACAHHLHNMFYVLGDATDRSDWPATVKAELYRANAIQNYDTVVIRSCTQRGADVLFIASHVTQHTRDPVFCYEFEEAAVHYGKFGDCIVAERRDGSRINYGSPTSAEWPHKLFDVLKSVHDAQPVVCGPEAAGAQTACIYAAQQSMPNIVDFPGDQIVVEGEPGERRTYVKDIETILDRCYEQFSLPSDLGVSWSAPGLEIAVNDKFASGDAASAGSGAILLPTGAARGLALKG